ncbi:MAG: hypothetical protein PHE33_08910 [Bacteroidales bacterium]|nr:hypothetical protein [Bacteroidales bacterium]
MILEALGFLKARDLARKKAQANAKKQKEQRAELLKIKAAKEQKPLSANKRRFLEDKQN